MNEIPGLFLFRSVLFLWICFILGITYQGLASVICEAYWHVCACKIGLFCPPPPILPGSAARSTTLLAGKKGKGIFLSWLSNPPVIYLLKQTTSILPAKHQRFESAMKISLIFLLCFVTEHLFRARLLWVFQYEHYDK